MQDVGKDKIKNKEKKCEKNLNRQQWINTYQSKRTKRQASIALKAFDNYLAAAMINEQNLFNFLRQNGDRAKYEMVQKLVNYWTAKKISGNSIKNYWNFVKNWWWHNDVKTYKDDLKAHVKFPRIQKEMREPLTNEIIKKIIDASNEPYKTVWYVLASSGMRIEEAISFDKESITWGFVNKSHSSFAVEHPTRILLSPAITKFATGREVFISKQAARHLKENLHRYLKLTPAHVETYFYKLRKRLDLVEKYSNGKNYKVQIHAFKSFFVTQAALVNGESYAHAVGGHGAYLPQYFRLPLEKRELMYLELEPHVTIK